MEHLDPLQMHLGLVWAHELPITVIIATCTHFKGELMVPFEPR